MHDGLHCVAIWAFLGLQILEQFRYRRSLFKVRWPRWVLSSSFIKVNMELLYFVLRLMRSAKNLFLFLVLTEYHKNNVVALSRVFTSDVYITVS